MKKLFTTSLLLCTFALRGLSQYYDPEQPEREHRRMDLNRVRFGAYIAPTVTWMKPTASKSNDGEFRVNSNGSNVGFAWGLMADYFFTENYGISTGFQLNNTGGNIQVKRRIPGDSAISFVSNADFDYKLQYLEVPFSLKLRSDELQGSGAKVFGQIGMSLGINIGKKASYEVDYWDADLQQGVSVSEEKEKLYGSFTVAPVMLQLNVGGGVERRISDKMSFYVGLFFNNGFAPDATNPDEYDLEYKGVFGDGNIRLNNFAIRLGLFF